MQTGPTLADPDAGNTERATERAMQVIEALLPEAIHALDPPVRSRLSDALLNVAVNRIIGERGPQRTAAILRRLADALVSYDPPQPGRPLDLSRMDG